MIFSFFILTSVSWILALISISSGLKTGHVKFRAVDPIRAISQQLLEHSSGSDKTHQQLNPNTPRICTVVCSNNKISFRDAKNKVHTLLDFVDDSIVAKMDSETGGIFLSFDFQSIKAQHDLRLGVLPPLSRILVHSRIKRWWMAPSFHQNPDTIPVETQLMLVELDSISSSQPKILNAFAQVTQKTSEIFGIKSVFPQKHYALIAPLIDFKRGFRVTLFGKEGGQPAGNGAVAARVESGDPFVQTAYVNDAIYIAVGTDPYQLLKSSYKVIADRMQTFRIR